jgi:hypothetical protein
MTNPTVLSFIESHSLKIQYLNIRTDVGISTGMLDIWGGIKTFRFRG